MQSIELYKDGKKLHSETVTHSYRARYKAVLKLGARLGADELRIKSSAITDKTSD